MMSFVSRETPAPPPSAREYFGARLALAECYAHLLAGPGTDRGLIGPREVDRLWDRHLLNCAVVHEAMPAGASVVDVGSGAGLPGVVLALMRPDLRVTLVEPMLRRVTYLNEVVAALELGNADVVRARAEDLHGRLVADRATARAVAPLPRLARWTLPLLAARGVLVAVRGSSVATEVEAAEAELAALGAVSWAVRTYGEGVVDPPTRVALVEVGDAVRQP